MSDESKKIWNALLSEIQGKVSTVSYEMWFSRAEALTVSYNKLIVVVPLKNIKTMLENEYRSTVQWALGQIKTYVTDVLFILPEDKSAYLEDADDQPPQPKETENPFDSKFTFEIGRAHV